MVAEALELSEAPALEAFGAVAVEVVSAKVAVSGWFGQQVVCDFEDMAADRQHCSSVPYVSAQAPASQDLELIFPRLNFLTIRGAPAIDRCRGSNVGP